MRRQRFIHYMTVCVDEYNSAGRCLTQLQKQKMLGVAHTYKRSSTVHHITQHTTLQSGFRIVGRQFSYRGHGKYYNISFRLLLRVNFYKISYSPIPDIYIKLICIYQYTSISLCTKIKVYNS